MGQVLSSWKEIANHLGKGVRTVQRWEKTLGLPIHRPGGPDHHVVVADPQELSEWMLRLRQRAREANRIRTILLVDDDPSVRFVTRAFLEEMGYIVLSCADGERATYIFENGPQVDLLLTDMQMPGMSGMELAERLTGKNARLPVIVVSGMHPDVADMVTMERRNWTFFAKPFDAAELAAAIASALQADGQTQAMQSAAPEARSVLIEFDATRVSSQGRAGMWMSSDSRLDLPLEWNRSRTGSGQRD